MALPRVRVMETMMGTMMDFDSVALMDIVMVQTWLGPLMASRNGSGRASQWDSYLVHSMAWYLEQFQSRGNRMYRLGSHSQMHSSPIHRIGQCCMVCIPIDLEALDKTQDHTGDKHSNVPHWQTQQDKRNIARIPHPPHMCLGDNLFGRCRPRR